MKYVPEKLLTKKLCELALKSNCYAINFIPKSLLSDEFYAIGVKFSIIDINDVPLEFRKKKVWNAYIYGDYINNLENLPEKFITRKLCLKCVRKYGQLLQYVPDKFTPLKI